MMAIKEQAKRQGWVETLLGRKRQIPELNASNPALRGAGERMAINMPIQGTAADILKLAMIDVHAALPRLAGGRARMILTVHDELLFEAPKESAEETAAAVASLMESAVTLKVPLTVDVGIGENWKVAKG
jgi:DNA polymerase-1